MLMKTGTNLLLGCLSIIVIGSFSVPRDTSASPLSDVVEKSTFTGTVRSYLQTRELDTASDQAVYALGAQLKLETGPFFGFNAATSFFTSSNLGSTRNDVRKGNPTLPVEEIHTFGEAYLQYDRFDTRVKIGRQLIDTPFLNPADSLLFPVSFFGYSLSNTSIKNVELIALHVTDIKIRQDRAFREVDGFITDQLGIASAETGGTTALGVKWGNDFLKVEGWDYYLPDLFNMLYLQGDATFPEIGGGVRPFFSFQLGKQFDVGENLLGGVDSTLYGARLGADKGPWQAAYAFNYLPKNAGNFRNGGFLSPYSFATDAIYTNMLDGGLTLKGSAFVGVAHTGSIKYVFWERLSVGFGYTFFDLMESVGGKDSTEYNINVLYEFKKGRLKGLSILNRLAIVDSELSGENLIEDRFRIQYVFDDLLKKIFK